MQMVKNIFITLLVLWFAILLFMPKQEFYYKLEEELGKNGVKINEKSIEEGLFSLTVHESQVFVKGIKLATVEKIDFFTLLFYTDVTVSNLLLDDSLKSIAPTQIDKASVIHAIWKPLNLTVDAEGSFGEMGGNIALTDRILRLDFNETKNIEILKPRLKNDEKGWYYETSF